MSHLRIFVSRARRLLRGSVQDNDLQQEIASHLEEATEDYVRQGLSPVEARRRALIGFGGVAQTHEAYRDAGSFTWVNTAVIDLRDALRGLRGGKGTIALAFAILTVALAAGTVTFSVTDAIVLRPLPYAQPERLIAIAHVPRTGLGIGAAAPQDYFSWREGSRSFEGLAAATGGTPVSLENNGAQQDLSLSRATANLFDVLGTAPIMGRVFTSEHETAGRDAVVVLTHHAWTRSFNADPDVIGKRITLSQQQSRTSYEVLGVLAAGVTYPVTAAVQPVDVFRPYVATAEDRDHAFGGRAYSLHVVGRLKPGVTLDQARADIDRVIAYVRGASPGAFRADTIVLPLLDRVAGPAKSWLLLFLAAVGCVVLVGCVNAASLLLARATVRTREFATRASLGASRGQLTRALLLEGVLLTFAAAGAALLLATWGVGVAKASLPEGLARASAIAIDVRVLFVSIAAAVVCGLVAGGVPAWRIGRSQLFAQMKTGGGIIGGRRQARALGAFLSAEVAFVTVLLVATALVVTTFVLLTTADLGFDRRNVMTISVSNMESWAGLPREKRPAATGFFNQVLDRARAVPGVQHAAIVAAGSAPLGGRFTRYSLVIPGIGEIKGEDAFETRRVSPDYFPAMGAHLLRGRSFNGNDRTDSPPVVIINELAARRYFPGREAIGQRVILHRRDTLVVGVVQNVRLFGPESDWRNELFIPMTQEPTPPNGELVIRTTGPAAQVASAVRDAIRPVLTGPTAPEAKFLDDVFRRLTAERRFNAGLMTIFGVLAAVIAAIGIYGTMAFFVAQQTRAIGLRMALGASQTSVLRSVLRESLWRVVLGVALGLLVARAVAGLFTSLVFGVQTTSPAVYAGVGMGLAAIGVLAALVPARRAARLDPLVALRAD